MVRNSSSPGSFDLAFQYRTGELASERYRRMGLVELLFSVTTGPKRRRAVLTPLVLIVVVGLFLLLLFLSLYIDKLLGLPRLLPGVVGTTIGLLLLTSGVALHSWCLVLFWRAKGTGIPVNPPLELVTVGPYAWTRNPMLIAMFFWLAGIGFLLTSMSMVFFWTPVFMVINLIELKLVEEPEIERRLGASFTEYKRNVPMLIPRVPSDKTRTSESE
jgi:protein-S-isoprenylcysteine O-methyltransferase Ste14